MLVIVTPICLRRPPLYIDRHSRALSLVGCVGRFALCGARMTARRLCFVLGVACIGRFATLINSIRGMLDGKYRHSCGASVI